ncbi:hypothetical protein AXF42_Ash010560 [Apostasia shenzhenica]|uniref:Retrovirus-related Pol polyprotein from transposon TNT 1-94-like beta-barrel domain-containing protein n=1 Tax=Apostasia shenzhenica TaxID=1088818 RepID=A0A2I0A6F8_9ASPA|nr:hypothetical protein AXF42_Ash010560 [Apostasia shenzhenica]
MTHDKKLFKELDRSEISKVRIANGQYLIIKGKGTVAIETCTGTKLITNILYVPEIDKNLLSVAQLLEKGFKVFFNQAAIAISNNSVFHEKTKHLNIKLFFLRDIQKEGIACLKYCKTKEQLADILQKHFQKTGLNF